MKGNYKISKVEVDVYMFTDTHSQSDDKIIEIIATFATFHNL